MIEEKRLDQGLPGALQGGEESVGNELAFCFFARLACIERQSVQSSARARVIAAAIGGDEGGKGIEPLGAHLQHFLGDPVALVEVARRYLVEDICDFGGEGALVLCGDAARQEKYADKKAKDEVSHEKYWFPVSGNKI